MNPAIQSLLEPIVAPGTLIFAEQNGARPDKPYASVTVTRITPISVVKGQVDVLGKIRLDQLQISTVEVVFFGLACEDRAEKAALRLHFPTHVERAERLGLGVLSVQSVSSVPEILNGSQFEDRAILQFTINEIFTIEDDVGLIERVDLDCFDHSHIIDSPNPA